MSQFRDFQVVTITGLTFAVWEIQIGPITGTFGASDSLQWDSSAGLGTMIGQVPTNNTIKFYRNSGAFPAVGNLLTSVSSGATATITGIVTTNENGRHINPPLFLTSPSQGALAVNDVATVRTAEGAFVERAITVVDAEDKFTVSPAWPSPFNIDVPGYVTRDFTPNLGLPLPSTGDAIIAQQIRSAFLKLDTQDPVGAWTTTHSYGTNWQDKAGSPFRFRAEHGRVILDGISEKTSAMAVSDVVMTLPSGFRPLYLTEYGTLADGNAVEIQTDGDVVVVTDGAVSDEIHFAGLSFPTT